ncbi:MAG: hypothetical protein WD557_13730 [Dehalococcoidia bacterium]
MLQRLKSAPLAAGRALGRLGARLVKLALIATAVTALMIALDAIFLSDDDAREDA